MLHEIDPSTRGASTHARLTPPLKWPGGKHYLARRIVDLMPPHLHYVEPYAGGLAVLLAKDPEGVSEVASDLHPDLANFWQVLQNPRTFRALRRRCVFTPFSQSEWEAACLPAPDADPVTRAWRFFVRCRQSLAGRQTSFAPLSRNRTRRGMNEQTSAWLTCLAGLPEVHARLLRVAFVNEPALDVIRGQDGPETLFYLDPPYLHDTRASTTEYGPHEMTAGQHEELLQALLACRGKVMLSGYRSDLYDRVLSRWPRHDFELPNNAAGGRSKRRMVESLWCNFPPANGP